MRAADTSIVVAAFATWHPAHDAMSALMTEDVGVPAHVLVECYSVLTRLPPPHRIAARSAATWLRERLSQPALLPHPDTVTALPALAAASDVSGGAVYDALVAVTARDAGALLLSRDRRAVRTYDRLGIDYTLVIDT